MIFFRRSAGSPAAPAPEWFAGSDRDFWLLKTLIADESRERLALRLSLASLALTSALGSYGGPPFLVVALLFFGFLGMLFASDGFGLFSRRVRFFDRLCDAGALSEASGPHRRMSALESLALRRLIQERSSWMRLEAPAARPIKARPPLEPAPDPASDFSPP